jgi:alpha-beta hydrolase superfamily lysophospholipase
VETTAEPTFLQGRGGPIFGWVHRPAGGGARGAVVLCPPLGREHLSSYRALRLLADRLAGNGILALRFDYRGTGDSAGAAGTGQVAAWVGSVADAASFAAGAVAGPVGLVGLRIGATLAVEAIGTVEAVDALVLWDPCPSPANFLREQNLLHRLRSTGSRRPQGADAGWLQTPGMAFSDQTVDDLRSLEWSRATVARLGDCLADGLGIAVLSRANEPLDPVLEELSGLPGVDHSVLTGQRELLETSTSPGPAREATLESITSYLSRRFPPSARRCTASTSTSACIDQGGEVVIERTVRLGPDGLFGMLTENKDSAPVVAAVPPCVLLLTVAAHHHIGPSRQWVELARRWAASGARVLRFDASGVGDSGDLDGPKAYTKRSVCDVVEAARAVSPDAPGEVILFGMCSGAFAASLAGHELAARAVYLVNQDRWYEGDDARNETSSGVDLAGPVGTLRRLRGRGVEVTVVVGPEDDEALTAVLSSAERQELFEPPSAGGTSDVRFVLIDALDHDLLTRSACQALAERLSPLVLESCGLRGPSRAE